jgi:polyphosphate glucokinase
VAEPAARHGAEEGDDMSERGNTNGKKAAVAVVAAPAPLDVNGPTTLAVDIGGTGLKASVLDAQGTMLVDRVRVPTTYPVSPVEMVETLRKLVEPLPHYDRVSVGFPGMVRGGKVLTAPHFVTAKGPGSDVVPRLLKQWTGFDLAAALTVAFARPTKVVNDADLQGAAVVEGKGLEMVVTLGTGVGTAIYYDGRLCPHLELAHHPLKKDETYDDRLGEEARLRIGKKKWNRRVEKAIATLYDLCFYDHLFIGGGNSKHVSFDLPANVSLVDNAAGILGGIKLWDRDHL